MLGNRGNTPLGFSNAIARANESVFRFLLIRNVREYILCCLRVLRVEVHVRYWSLRKVEMVE